VQEIEDLVGGKSPDEVIEHRSQACRIHHPNANTEFPGDLYDLVKELRKGGTDIPPIDPGILGCELDLLLSQVDRFCYHGNDILCWIAHQFSPGMPRNAVGALTQASLGNGDNERTSVSLTPIINISLSSF